MPNQPGSRPATEADVLQAGGFLSINVGDIIAPAGLYASDHDMFAFMVNEQQTLEAAPGGRETMSRGFFIENSEVGDRSYKLTCFLYEHVCGNHIVWGAKDVLEFSWRHVGRNAREFELNARRAVRDMHNRSTTEDMDRIRAAKRLLLGVSKDQVTERTRRVGGVSLPTAESAYELAEQYSDIHGDPNSAWGISSGLTRLSQQSNFADDRAATDRAARKILEIAF